MISMIWFKQQYLWIMMSVAAVYISCQELTSTQRDGSHTCRGKEVTFICTIRGSINVSDLILAWSSAEYIGQGNPLRFTSQEAPGTKRTSMINGNVTAKLTSNIDIDGVPILVSELHIIADQASTVTCTSETTTSSNNTLFNVSDIPEPPLNVGALGLRSLSESDCEVLVKWDPPAISFDIAHYIVYVPALDVNINETSFITSLLLRNCPETFGVTVAAINRFGCIGISSSEVCIELTPQSTSPPAPEFGSFDAGAVVGISIGSAVGTVIIICCICCVLNCCIIGCCDRCFELYYDCLSRFWRNPADTEALLVEEHVMISRLRNFGTYLKDLYEALKQNNTSKQVTVVGFLISTLEELNNDNIKKELMTVLEVNVASDSASDVKVALCRLKKMIPGVMLAIDDELEIAGSFVTMDKVIEAAKKGNHKELLIELIKQVDKAPPEDVKGHLRKLFRTLKKYLDAKEEELQSQKSPGETAGRIAERITQKTAARIAEETAARIAEKTAVRIAERTAAKIAREIAGTVQDDGSDTDEEVLEVPPDKEWITGAYPLRLYSDGGYQ